MGVGTCFALIVLVICNLLPISFGSYWLAIIASIFVEEVDWDIRTRLEFLLHIGAHPVATAAVRHSLF